MVTATVSRSRQIAEQAAVAIEAMRRSSKAILKTTTAAGGVVAQTGIDVVRMIWESMMNILRFLARIFGVKLKSQADQNTQAELPASTAHAFSPESTSDANAAAPAHAPKTADEVDKTADQALKIIDASKTLPPTQAAGFLRALEFAGLQDADLALIDYARQPAAMRSQTVSENLLGNSLERVILALSNLDHMTLTAHAERSTAALAFSSRYAPPMLTEDLVAIQRNALDKGLVPPEDLPAVKYLLSSHDAIAKVEAHRQTIIGSTMLVVAQAVKANISLESFEDRLKAVGGGNWAQKLTDAIGEMDRVAESSSDDQAPASAPISAPDVTAELASHDRIDVDIASNSAAAAQAGEATAQLIAQQTLGKTALEANEAAAKFLSTAVSTADVDNAATPVDAAGGKTSSEPELPKSAAAISLEATQARVRAANVSSGHNPIIDAPRFSDDVHDKPIN